MGRTRQRRLMAGVFAVLILAFHPLSVSAQSQQELKAVQRDLEQSKARAEELKQKAERAASESKGVSGRLVAKAAEIQNLESTIAALDAEIGELAGKAAAKKTAIIAENRNLGVMLAALARLSQHPPEILLLKPEEAAATVRTASLLSLTLPAIQDKAKSLKNDLGELTELRNGILSAREEQRQALAALRTEEAALKRLQAEKQTLYRDLSANLQSENERLAKLAREAKDLEALLARVERERPAGDGGAFSAPSFAPRTSFAKARGFLPYPALGRVTQRFGDKTAGGAAKGITLEVRAGAAVVAPFDGQVIFAGPFRSYGLLLIISHGDGYHTLLAGLSRIDGEVGQWVLAGEPVGAMPETRVAGRTEAGALGAAPLYLEFRKNGAPFNPLPWLKK